MISRLLLDDPEADKQIIHHYDPVEKRVTLETRFNVEDIMEAAKAERNAHSDYRPFAKGDQHKVGTVPLPMMYELMKRGLLDQNGQGEIGPLKEFLNDPAFGNFRTMPGKI